MGRRIRCEGDVNKGYLLGDNKSWAYTPHHVACVSAVRQGQSPRPACLRILVRSTPVEYRYEYTRGPQAAEFFAA